MTILIHMNQQSKPIIRKHVMNAYTKGNLYCVYFKNGDVKKYPLCNIFEITENYKG